MQDPVHAVLVVCGGEDLGNDEFARAGGGAGFVAEVGVLEEDAGVFFVDADGVLDRLGVAGAVHKVCVQVVDRALAVAAESEGVGHVTAAVLAEVESVFALVRVIGVTVWDDHLGEGETVEAVTHGALVVELDVGEDDTLTVVEADVGGPVLPLDGAAIHLEGHALGLGDLDWLEVVAEATLGLDGFGMVVDWWGLVQRATNWWDVDVDDGLGVGAVDGAEVEGVGVLGVVWVWAVVHQRLLQSDVATEALIVSNGPWVAVDLVHVLWWNTNDTALLNDARVRPDSGLHSVQVLHCDDWLDTWGVLPLGELLRIKVNLSIVHLALSDADDICYSGGPGGGLWGCEPLLHESLLWLKEGDGIEEDTGMLLVDNGDGLLDFGGRERVKWVRWGSLARDLGRDLL